MAGLGIQPALPVFQVLRGLSLSKNRLTSEDLTLIQ